MKKVFKNYNRSISVERRSTLKNLSVKDNASMKRQSNLNMNNSLSRIRVSKNNITEENDKNRNKLQINKENVISIQPKFIDLKTSDIDILLKKTYYNLTRNGSLISSKFQNFILKTLKIDKVKIVDIEIIYKKMSNKKGFLDYYGFVYSLKELSKKLYSKEFLDNSEYLKKMISEYFSENEYFKTLLSSKSIVFHILENSEFKTILKNNVKILWTVYLKFFPLLNEDKKYILMNKYSSNKEINRSLSKRRSSLNNFKYVAEHNVSNYNQEKLNEIKEIANSKSFMANQNSRKNSISSKLKFHNEKPNENFLSNLSKYEKRNSLSNRVDIKIIDDNYGKIEVSDINKNTNNEIDFDIEKEIKLCYIEMINTLKLVPDCFSLKKGLELFSKISMDNIEFIDEICEFIIDSLKTKEEKIEEISHNSSYSFSGLKLENEPADKNSFYNVNYNTPFSFYTFLTSIFYFSYHSENSLGYIVAKMKSYFDCKLKNNKEMELKIDLVNNLKDVKETMKEINENEERKDNKFKDKSEFNKSKNKLSNGNSNIDGNMTLLKKLFNILSSKAIKPILNIFKHFCQSSNILITYGIEMSRQSFMNLVNYFKFSKTFNVNVNDFNTLFNMFCGIKPEVRMSNNISKVGNSTSNYLTFADFLKIMVSLSYLKNSKYTSKPIYQTMKGSQGNLSIENLHLNFDLILSVDDCYPRHIEKTVFQFISSSLKPNNYGFIENDLETHKSCINAIEARINEAVKIDGNLNLMLCMIEPIMYEIFTKYSSHYHNIKEIKEREENFKMISKSFIDFKRKSVNDLSSLNTNIHATNSSNFKSNETHKINSEKLKAIELNYDKFKNKSKYFSTMTIKHFLSFCNDFNLNPDLMINKKDIFTLFSSFIANMDDYYIFNNKEFSITFENFYFLLIMIAGETPIYDSGKNTLFEKVFFLFDNLDIKGFESKKLLNLKHKINEVLNKFKNMLILNEKKEQFFKNINDVENMEKNHDIFGM